MKFWEKKPTRLHHSLNQMAHSSKATDISNFFNDFFISKISKLRDDIPATNADTTHPNILYQIMKDNNWTFEFLKVSVEDVKNYCCLSTMTSHRGLTIWMENY